MTRRESVRVILFARGTLIGTDRSLRCAVTNLSAAGAMLTVTTRLPTAPLRLALELGGETLEFEVEIERVLTDAGIAVSFPRPHSERLHRLIATEQRKALAQGQVNISERRVPRSFQATRGEVLPPADGSGA
jgi:hypothetical protein